jgi:hypothetical protein
MDCANELTSRGGNMATGRVSKFRFDGEHYECLACGAFSVTTSNVTSKCEELKHNQGLLQPRDLLLVPLEQVLEQISRGVVEGAHRGLHRLLVPASPPRWPSSPGSFPSGKNTGL